jgi:uncharacterized protein YoxC
MIWQISIACIAAAFIALVGFLIAALQTARAHMKQMNQTLERIDLRMEEMSAETVKVMHTAQQVTEDVHGKLKALDSLFQSIGQVGESVQQVTSSVKQVSATVTQSVKQAGQTVQGQQPRIAEVIEWAAWGFQVVQKWQQRKQQKANQPKPTMERDDPHVGS